MSLDLQNPKSVVNWLFVTLVAVVSFFLFMFYKKVEKIDDNITNINLTNAVKDVKIESISNRISNLESAVRELNTVQSAKK